MSRPVSFGPGRLERVAGASISVVSIRGSKIESSLSSANISVLYFYQSGTGSSWNRKPQRLDAAIEAENGHVGHFQCQDMGIFGDARSHLTYSVTTTFIIFVL